MYISIFLNLNLDLEGKIALTLTSRHAAERLPTGGVHAHAVVNYRE